MYLVGGQYELNFEQAKMIENAMKGVAEQSEKLVNNVLHLKGSKWMMLAIVGFMPVSNRNKPHAKFSNPLKIDKLNLGFRVYAKGGAANRKNSFGYLVFPDEGRGSSNPVAHKFFEKGAQKEEEHIFLEVLKALDDATKLD